ncbi:MAG TPA: AI-2E family transporter [Chloroflexi bacterium]|jgi:predicted PurR-regulated permease PerM|nr:AI-2E family transporter [Chloroflexota bacterium]
MMPSWWSSPTQRYRVLLLIAGLVLALLILSSAWAALVPFMIGLVIAYILSPFVNFIDRHAPRFMRRAGVSRPLAILLAYIFLFGLISGLLSYFIPAVVSQSTEFGRAVPDYLDRLDTLLRHDLSEFLDRVPVEIRSAVEGSVDQLVLGLTDALQRGLGQTVRTIPQTVSFVLGVVIVPFWMFYVLNDEAKAIRSFYGLIPEKAREDVRCIASIVDDLLSAYIRGKLLVSLLVGVMCLIALLIIGVDLALLLATFAGMFEFIPILGPYLGAIPAMLVALLGNPGSALWVALAYFIIQQIESIFLSPRIAGSAVRFHPAVVMVLVLVGSEVAGLWGMFFVVPVAAVARDVFRYLYLRTTERGATPQMALEILRARSIL